MKPDDDIFAEALELPAAERAAFLAQACAGDEARRARLEALLVIHDTAQGFMEDPAPGRPALPVGETPGDIIGPYTLVRRLGEGGCGVVWLAEQTRPLRRTVALKIIKPGMDSHSVIARFEAERQALARMTHPDIAQVYDAGATPSGRPYFVMEYVEGVPVTRFCDEQRLPMAARLGLFARLCQAVQHAHQKGIIHRDLKPSNILVSLRDGLPAPKVIDFGIAKATAGRLSEASVHTELGFFLGTPAYMSPEQAELRETDLDTRSDVYALGVLLYELLTGRPPYDPQDLVRAGVLEIRRIIREVDPPRPSTAIATLTDADRDTVARLRGAAAPRLTADLQGDLDWIVMRCLEKDRERRYGTASALAEDVQRHLRHEPVEARPPSRGYRLRKFVARNRLACVSAAALAITLIAGVAVSTTQAIRATRAEHLAAAERDAATAAGRAETLARADAQRRQEQAEDLLTFMLGDFRTELQKIGQLNLLDTVGAKAMTYFADLDPRDLSDAALTRQARALTQIGEVRLEQARYPEADEAFTTAYRRTSALTARHPTDGDLLFERGQAEYWIGFVARRRGDTATQRAWLVRYRDTALALAAAEGPTRRAQLEVVYGHHNLAVIDLDAGRLDEARTGFTDEQATLDRLLADAPADRDLLYHRADNASWLGSVAERDGRYAEAATHYAEMARRYADLTLREPKTALWRFEHAQALTFVARIATITGHPAEAVAPLADAHTLLAELVAQDPANRRRQATFLGLQLTQAEPLLYGPHPAEALPALAAARTGLEALVVAEPTAQNFSRGLVIALRLQARALLATGRLPEAESAITQARQVITPLLRTSPGDIWVRYEAAQTLLVAALMARDRAQPDAARDLAAEALAALGPAATASRDWRLLEPAALATRLMAGADVAGPLVTRLQSFGYHPADPLIAGLLGLTASPVTTNP